MTRWLLPVLLGAICAASAAAPAGAVVNGTPVDPATVPWFTSVGSCGATLVAPDRLLTAGHCVYGQTPAELGGVAIGGATRRVAHVAMHPNWRARNGTDNFLDDVAIVALDAPVAGVPLVALGGAAPETAHILGRGRPFAPGTGHSEAESLDSTLRTADLRLISDDECAAAFAHRRRSTAEKFDARMRCALDADGLEPLSSGCFGDSGGPLWTGTPEAPIQLGIVSWGGKCGADHLPSVFADVARYRAFITHPAPTWAPTQRGTVRITRAGHRLTCSAKAAEPGVTLAYIWKSKGRFAGGTYRPPATVGHGRTYRLRSTGRYICDAEAGNAGGAVRFGVASVLVR